MKSVITLLLAGILFLMAVNVLTTFVPAQPRLAQPQYEYGFPTPSPTSIILPVPTSTLTKQELELKVTNFPDGYFVWSNEMQLEWLRNNVK